MLVQCANAELEELTEIPEEKVIVLDTSLGTETHLLNVVSLERYKLPHGGTWQIELDGDGDGVAADVGPNKHPAVVVHTVMKKRVFQGDGGFFWLCWTEGGHEIKEPLEAKKSRYSSLDVKIPPRDLGSPDPWHCFIMAVPRQSFFMFWDVLDLYNNLRMTCYGKDPTTWAHRARKSMGDYMQHAGLMPEANMLGSVRALKVASNSVDEAEPHSSGRFCLPTFALSTPAFVVMLAKMGHCTPQQGGLRSEAGKRLARNALGDLLQALTKPGGFQLHIRFIQDTLYF